MNCISTIQRFLNLNSVKMVNLKLNLIAACDSKLGIGLQNNLPWRLRNEMAYFNRMTTAVSNDAALGSGESKKNVVVMGRKTWDSIPTKFRPLKDRINVILSSRKPTTESDDESVIWASSWEEIIQKLMELQESGKINKVWVTGGGFLYKLALESPHCYRIYLTRIQNDYGCDVFFPNFDEQIFQAVRDPEVPEGDQEECNVKYNFHVYEKSD